MCEFNGSEQFWTKLKGHLRDELDMYLAEKILESQAEIPELIPRMDLAQKLKISLTTLDKWIKYNVVPKSIKIGGRVYFKIKEVRELIDRGSVKC